MSDSPASQPENQEAIDLVHKLFIKHSLAIRGYLLALNPDINQVDDLMHTVFLCLTSKATLFDPTQSFVAWARGFAKIELLRLGQQKQRSPISLSSEVIETLSESVPSLEPTSQRMAIIAECMETLAPRARDTIRFRYLKGLRPAAIAERMKITIRSVNVTLSRARTMLRTCVQQKLRSEKGGE